ncbi:hypothetical protein KIW84_020488 [Lathyrus oleraceus]|uniref:Aminotransferase-like plant mobile domain-containing protein n=1 Tax=Pisum sativum TaxID=3888 RepID=A0A9D4Y9A1_PEA|nr:hypothetical protein KIW84_020488 [Pisum sativum]
MITISKTHCVMSWKSISYLKQYYASIILSEESTEYEKIIKARCYIMILFGNFLFPESTGNSVNIMYLPLLRNINKVSIYSWGSVVLTHLYSAMCKKAKKNTCTFFFMCVFATSMRLVKNVVTRPDKR